MRYTGAASRVACEVSGSSSSPGSGNFGSGSQTVTFTPTSGNHVFTVNAGFDWTTEQQVTVVVDNDYLASLSAYSTDTSAYSATASGSTQTATLYIGESATGSAGIILSAGWSGYADGSAESQAHWNIITSDPGTITVDGSTINPNNFTGGFSTHTVIFTPDSTGQYTIEAWHDLNGDGKLDDGEQYYAINVNVVSLNSMTIADTVNTTNAAVTVAAGGDGSMYVASTSGLQLTASINNEGGTVAKWEVVPEYGEEFGGVFTGASAGSIPTPLPGEYEQVYVFVDKDDVGVGGNPFGDPETVIAQTTVYTLPAMAVWPESYNSTTNSNQPGTSSGIAATSLLSPGAFVPINNDDDNYANYSNTSNDMTAATLAANEDDLLKITLPAVSGSDPGHYTLTVPSGVRIWTSDKAHFFTSTQNATLNNFSAASSTDIYVEGTASGAGNLTVTWANTAGTASNFEAVNIIVFNWSGALNVPGDSIYEYTANATIAGAGWVTPVNGSISHTTTANDVNIFWSESAGGDVGGAKYTVDSDYTWGLEVHVVQVLITAPTGSAFTRGTVVDDGSFNTGTIVKKLVTAGTYPASPGLSVAASLTLSGPTVNGVANCGVSQLRVGFVQIATTFQNDGSYQNAGVLKSNIDSIAMPVLDTIDRSDLPWYYSGANAVFTPTANSRTTTIWTNDSPFDGPPLTNGTNSLLSMTTKYAFEIDIDAVTTDTQNNANGVFTIRANGTWSANLSGSVGAGPTYPWTAGASATISSSTAWNLVSTGSQSQVIANFNFSNTTNGYATLNDYIVGNSTMVPAIPAEHFASPP